MEGLRDMGGTDWKEKSEGLKTEDGSGLTDLHFHAGWTDFYPEDQRKRSAEEIESRIKNCLSAYSKAGIVRVRDAGGYTGYDPMVELSSGMLGGGDNISEDAINAACRGSGSWTKIFATGGVGLEPGRVLEPKMSRECFAGLIRKLHGAGKKVMVHCWGGVSLDWCMEYGADSIEHGVYMDSVQAAGLAGSGIPLIPTTSIYRLLAEEPGLFCIDRRIRDNAARAAEAQLVSVHRALSEGVLIGYGTDFYCDPELIKYAGYELDTLMDCGLSRKQALLTGTVNAGMILKQG